MTSKDMILKLLESRRGDCVSGTELAAELGVSRNAVWKTIGALIADGAAIEVVPHKGYRIDDCADVLSEQGIQAHLNANANIKIYKQLDSTNIKAKQLAAEGAEEGTVVIAASQSGGKGRQGRKFFSPESDGLYMSLILRPRKLASAQDFTVCAAIAVARAVAKIGGKEPQIKWVNDVYVSGGKCCGILTEAAIDMESGNYEYVIVGIGVNIFEPKGGFPDELKGIASATCDRGTPNARNSMAAEIINEFMSCYLTDDKSDIFAEYRNLSMLDGKRVTVCRGEIEREAIVESIDDECRLVVRYADGTSDALCSGEVRIIPCRNI